MGRKIRLFIAGLVLVIVSVAIGAVIGTGISAVGLKALAWLFKKELTWGLALKYGLGIEIVRGTILRMGGGKKDE